MLMMKHEGDNEQCRSPSSDCVRSEECLISRLPISILLRIFSLFSYYELNYTISFVCRHWLKLARDPVLYQELSFTGVDSKHQLWCIKNKISASQLLKSLVLRRCDNVSGILQRVGKSCTHLKKLKIDYCNNITADSMRAVVLGCPNIEVLKIRDCEVRSITILTDLCQLKILDLTNFDTINVSTLHLFVDKCRKLEKVVLGGIALQDGDLVSVVCKLKETLLKLVFSGAAFVDDSYVCLAECTKLRDLRLLHADKLTHKGMHAIATLKNLECIHIDRAFNLAELNMIDLFLYSSFKNLVCIKFYNSVCVTDKVLEIVGENHHKLIKLYLSNCKHISDNGIKFVVRKCQDLKHLSLYSLPNVTTECLNGLPQSHPCMESLHVALCPLVNYFQLALLKTELRCLHKDDDMPEL